MNFEEIIKDIDNRIENPMISAKFGDRWKEHQMRMFEEGQINVEMLINIAWKQGRRNLLLEKELKRLIE